MKYLPRRLRLNRSWLVLGGAIVLGFVATALNHKTQADLRVQLDAQVRAAYRMITVVLAKKALSSAAQVELPVSVQRRGDLS